MEYFDGTWIETIRLEADTQAALKKKITAVARLLAQFDKEKTKARRAPGEGTIFRRRSTGAYGAQIELEPGPNGERRRSKAVTSKDHATVVKALQKMKEDFAQGLEQVDKRLTVEAWLKYWIDNIAKPRMRPLPWKTYRGLIDNQIIPAIGNRQLDSLKPEHVRYMHDFILQSTHTKRDPKTKEKIQVPYTTRTVEAAHNVLSVALNDAIAEGKAHRNVCEVASKPKVLSKSHGELTSEQARVVLLTAMQDADRMVTRWAAGMMLGGRQGELLGLQWDRIDFERGSLDLAWQLEWLPLKPDARPDDPGRFDVPAAFEYVPLWRSAALTRPKTTMSQRMIPLPEPLAAILQVHRQQCTPNPWDLVWVSSRTTPISDLDDRNAWKSAQVRAKIAEPVDVHAMRGTTATLLLEADVDAKVIQAILGHASVITTRGYQRVDMTLARKALGNLDALLELD